MHCVFLCPCYCFVLVHFLCATARLYILWGRYCVSSILGITTSTASIITTFSLIASGLTSVSHKTLFLFFPFPFLHHVIFLTYVLIWSLIKEIRISLIQLFQKLSLSVTWAQTVKWKHIFRAFLRVLQDAHFQNVSNTMLWSFHNSRKCWIVLWLNVNILDLPPADESGKRGRNKGVSVKCQLSRTV